MVRCKFQNVIKYIQGTSQHSNKAKYMLRFVELYETPCFHIHWHNCVQILPDLHST
jgi:hypothetical protein